MLTLHKNISSDVIVKRYNKRSNIEYLRLHVKMLRDSFLKALLNFHIDGFSYSQLSCLTGRPKTSIYRIIQREIQRTNTLQYKFVLRYKDNLTKDERNVAIDYYIRGLTISEISKNRLITKSRINKIIKCIKAMSLNKEQ